jgi:hypothetical protein
MNVQLMTDMWPSFIVQYIGLLTGRRPVIIRSNTYLPIKSARVHRSDTTLMVLLDLGKYFKYFTNKHRQIRPIELIGISFP